MSAQPPPPPRPVRDDDDDDDDGPAGSVTFATTNAGVAASGPPTTPYVPRFDELTKEQQDRIMAAQKEIEEIWNKKGNYTIDDDAWRTMPIFMEDVSQEAVDNNAGCAALASIVYGVDPEETATNRKEAGNKMLLLAMKPDQEKPVNVARAAIHHYGEALAAGCSNVSLNSQIYSNRSACHYIMQNFGRGLEDAQRAIVLDPQYTKAYYRGARCAERIRKYDIALRLIEKAYETRTPPSGAALSEFAALKDTIEKGKLAESQKQQKDKAARRAAAAKSANMAKDLQTAGINVTRRMEITSEQFGQYGNHKPYFDEEGVLITPLLLLYDEVGKSDFMQQAGCDCSVRQLLDELRPFAWDEWGEYNAGDVLALYKIDDGVAMPKWYTFDLDWQLLEVFRSSTYEMPGLLPCIHLVRRGSPWLQHCGEILQSM